MTGAYARDDPGALRPPWASVVQQATELWIGSSHRRPRDAADRDERGDQPARRGRLEGRHEFRQLGQGSQEPQRVPTNVGGSPGRRRDRGEPSRVESRRAILGRRLMLHSIIVSKYESNRACGITDKTPGLRHISWRFT